VMKARADRGSSFRYRRAHRAMTRAIAGQLRDVVAKVRDGNLTCGVLIGAVMKATRTAGREDSAVA